MMIISPLSKFVNKIIKEIDEFYVVHFDTECTIKIANNEHIVIKITSWRNGFNIKIQAKGNMFMEDSLLTISSSVEDEDRAKQWILTVIEYVNKVLLAGEL